MRLGLLLGCLGAWSAWGSDARVAYLSKQLAGAEDLRLKMQLVVALGAIPTETVVPPLCRALKDKEPLVRQAAIKSLARLHYFSRLPCLESAAADANKAVSNEAVRALQLASRRLSGYGFVVAEMQPPPSQNPGDNGSVATQILASKLSGMGAHVAKERERVFRQIPMERRYKLQVKASQSEEALRLEMLVMTFPGQSLKANFSVQARGKSVAVSKALEQMVNRLLEEAAEEMKWFDGAEGG